MLPSIIYGFLYSILPLILMIVGTRFPSLPFMYASILSILILIILRTFNILTKHTDVFLIYCIGLTLIFQNTLPTNYLLGIDIHTEYFLAQLAIKNGWDITLPYQYNTSILSGLIIPFLTKYLGISLETLFKIILPLILAIIPVVCYYIFNKIYNSKIAFLSSIFFISVPTFFLELPGNSKQIVGELLLILTLYVLFISKLSNVKKGVLALILGGLSITTHYSMGFILIPYILGATLILLGIKYILKQDIKISLKPPITILLILVLLATTYYSLMAKGILIKTIEGHLLFQIAQGYYLVGLENPYIIAKAKEVEKEVSQPPFIVKSWIKFNEVGPPITSSTTPSLSRYLNGQEETIRAAIGLDFTNQSTLGKTFRIFQYITQLMLILGLISFFIRKDYNKNFGFTSLYLSGWVLLSLVVLYPTLSGIMNASRFYNLALLFIAPSLILIIEKRPKWILLLILPYLLFTSGFTFEAFKVNTANTFSIPYSYGLSGYRVDLTTINSDNDRYIRDYLDKINAKDIYADQWGFTFLADTLAENISYLPDDCTKIPPDAYIFLRERNVDTNTVCYWVGIGKRINIDFTECKLDKELEQRSIIKECGSARLYGPK